MEIRALLILADGFEEIEAVAPMDLLRRAGIEVTLCGLDSLAVKSARGLCVTAETTLGEISGDFDALILPGGAGAKKLASSPSLRALILEMFNKKKWICAICASPVWVLFPTGILSGKQATCYIGMEDGLDSSVKYRREKVVVDGNLITSQSPGTAIEFALTIIEKLKGKSESEKIRKGL
jgi:4-methyl-5(b-hydroxyethyl)-thiazole monophosphate biosynthesis